MIIEIDHPADECPRVDRAKLGKSDALRLDQLPKRPVPIPESSVEVEENGPNHGCGGSYTSGAGPLDAGRELGMQGLLFILAFGPFDLDVPARRRYEVLSNVPASAAAAHEHGYPCRL